MVKNVLVSHPFWLACVVPKSNQGECATESDKWGYDEASQGPEKSIINIWDTSNGNNDIKKNSINNGFKH